MAKPLPATHVDKDCVSWLGDEVGGKEGVANVNDRNRVGFFITLFCVGAFVVGLKKDTLEIQR